MEQHIPMSEKLRPHTLAEFIGQEHLSGAQGIVNKLLTSCNTTGFFPSLILWGPPGCGKTTLARIIAQDLGRKFFEFSAVNASVKDIEKAISENPVQSPNRTQKEQVLPFIETEVTKPKTYKLGAPVIFIDELHRFNKAQQDALLPHVERGRIVLIGATTENPSFEVISPLLSRCRVLVLKQHAPAHLETIITRALASIQKHVAENTMNFLVQSANGDARVALNVLEIANSLVTDDEITLENMEQALQRKQLNFDLKGDEFYKTISAFHKSIRGSDPNASLYYLARMLEAGQDPLYIARRLIRMASEDIGLTNPQALTLAVSAFQACERLGMPECNLALAEITVYLAKSPKSNKLYMAYSEVAADVRNLGNLPIPLHILNAPTSLMKNLGYGKNYEYSHSANGKKNEAITYLPEELKDKKYFE